MLMTDLEIRRMQIADNVITPYFSNQLQPASYDLTLSDRFVQYNRRNQMDDDGWYIDPAKRELGWNVSPDEQTFVDDTLKLYPGQFVLGETVEHISMPNDVAARFEGKSTLGRYGLTTHITAGFIDPGFKGTITLEIRNDNYVPILLTPGMRIGQICFFQLDHPVSKPYGSSDLGSHYQHQQGPTVPR